MRGFEPLTPWLQTRCSAGLSYIPGFPTVYAPGVAGLTGEPGRDGGETGRDEPPGKVIGAR